MELNYLLSLRKAKGISDYQFGSQITDILFDNEEKINIEFSKNTGKIKHIRYNNEIILNYRPNNGFFTLTLFSAKKIIENVKTPTLRAIVLTEISEFIKKGRNVFCKHVVDIDNNLRPLDEVIVVNQEDDLLAIGRLMIPIPYVKSFKTGIAINVRKGIYKSKI
ncbi:MAG: PUA domain-containing protein [Candidatus Hodarchaeota archaeon]